MPPRVRKKIAVPLHHIALMHHIAMKGGEGGTGSSSLALHLQMFIGMRKQECMGSDTQSAVFDNRRGKDIAGKGITCEYLAYIYRNSLDFKHFLFILPSWLIWKNP